MQMTEFLRKTLASCEFDQKLDSYVYSVHDLHLEYIKSQLRDDEGSEMVTIQ
jgi:hypothetical protein